MCQIAGGILYSEWISRQISWKSHSHTQLFYRQWKLKSICSERNRLRNVWGRKSGSNEPQNNNKWKEYWDGFDDAIAKDTKRYSWCKKMTMVKCFAFKQQKITYFTEFQTKLINFQSIIMMKPKTICHESIHKFMYIFCCCCKITIGKFAFGGMRGWKRLIEAKRTEYIENKKRQPNKLLHSKISFFFVCLFICSTSISVPPNENVSLEIINSIINLPYYIRKYNFIKASTHTHINFIARMNRKESE